VVGPVPTVARALDLLERDRVDFAILDVNLGRKRSAPVAEALRVRGVPFALATGYEGRKLPEKAFRDAQHLGKPIDFHLLAETIRRLTDDRETPYIRRSSPAEPRTESSFLRRSKAPASSML
jgi:hypothetical protein